MSNNQVSAETKQILASKELKQSLQNLNVLELIDSIEDFRIDRTKLYSAADIILSTIMAIMVGARSWYEIADYAEDLLGILRTYYPFKNGTPSHDTYNRFFSTIQPENLEKVFSCFFTSGLMRINLDGKQIKDSTQAKGQIIHIVTAWSDELQLSLGQLKVDAKSNEITAIPKLLNELDITGCEITSDAMGNQVDIVQQITDQGGYYTIALKGNQEKTFEQAKILASSHRPSDTAEETDACKGLVVERTCEVFSVTPKNMPIASKWANLKNIVKITRTTTYKKTKEVTEDVLYYMSSMQADAAHFLNSTRHHWRYDLRRKEHSTAVPNS